jgi:5-methylcytosine-specific restriction endonuclease McrA
VLKTCSKCNVSLPETSFYKDKKGKKGLRKSCKQCDISRSLAHKKVTHALGGLGYWRYRVNMTNASCRKNYNIQDKLKAEDVLSLYISQKDICYYCESECSHVNLQIEHKDPLAKGGLNNISNIVLSCSKCNMLKVRPKHSPDKRNLNEEEFFSYIEKLHAATLKKRRNLTGNPDLSLVTRATTQ